MQQEAAPEKPPAEAVQDLLEQVPDEEAGIASIENPETLAGSAGEVDGNGGVRHSLVTMSPGNFTGKTGTNRTIVILDAVAELTAGFVFD